MRYIIASLLILTMVLIPYSVHGHAPLFITILSTFSILGICAKIPGSEFLLIAIALCLPSGYLGWTAHVAVSFPEIDAMKHSFNRFILFITPILGIVLMMKSNFPHKDKIRVLLLGVLLTGIISYIITFDTNEFNGILRQIGYSYSFLFICYYDRKLKIEDVFLFIDVLFCISFIHGILEYVFRMSPYQYLTEATTSINWIFRAKGILGHPLYLSGLALFYQSVIFVRYLLFKKFGYVQEFMCVVTALIVVSRTTIIIMILEYIFFVIITKGYKNKTFWIWNSFFILVGVFLIIKYANSVVMDIITRFDEDGAGNRETALQAVLPLFLDNPLGVGYSNIMDKIAKGGYGALGFDDEFSTVDNLFLSQLAAYGIFSICKIGFYFYFLYDAFKNRKNNSLLFKTILFLYFPYFFESFSFDWDTSIFLCMFLYGTIGFIYRYCDNTKKTKFDINEVTCNHRYLQRDAMGRALFRQPAKVDDQS